MWNMPDLLVSFKSIHSLLYGTLWIETKKTTFKVNFPSKEFCVGVCVQPRLMDTNKACLHCFKKAILALICCTLHPGSLSSFHRRFLNSQLILWIAITIRPRCEGMLVVLSDVIMSPLYMPLDYFLLFYELFGFLFKSRLYEIPFVDHKIT